MPNLFFESAGKRSLYYNLQNIVPAADVVPGDKVTDERFNLPHGNLKDAVLALDDYTANWAAYYDDTNKNITINPDLYIGAIAAASNNIGIAGVTTDLALFSRKNAAYNIQITNTTRPILKAFNNTTPTELGLNNSGAFIDTVGALHVGFTIYGGDSITGQFAIRITPVAFFTDDFLGFERVDGTKMKIGGHHQAGLSALAMNVNTTFFDTLGNLTISPTIGFINIGGTIFSQAQIDHSQTYFVIGNSYNNIQHTIVSGGVRITANRGGIGGNLQLNSPYVYIQPGLAKLEILPLSPTNGENFIDGSIDGEISIGTQMILDSGQYKITIRKWTTGTPRHMGIIGPSFGLLSLAPNKDYPERRLSLLDSTSGITATVWKDGPSAGRLTFGVSGAFWDYVNGNNFYSESGDQNLTDPTVMSPFGFIVAPKNTITSSASPTMPANAPVGAMVVHRATGGGGAGYYLFVQCWTGSAKVWMKVQLATV